MLCNSARELQIQICDGESRIVPADQGILDGRGNGACSAQFAKDLVPLADGNAPLGTGKGIKDVVQALEGPRRELNSLLGSVKDPTKDNLASAPVGISLAKLLGRDGLLTQGGIAGNLGMENFINCMLIVMQGCGGRSTTPPQVNQVVYRGFDLAEEGAAATPLANVLALYSILLGGKGEKHVSGCK